MEWRERLINNLFNTITKDLEDEKGYLEQDDMLYTFGPIDFFTTLDQALSSISQCGQKDVSTTIFKQFQMCFLAYGTSVVCSKTNIGGLQGKFIRGSQK